MEIELKLLIPASGIEALRADPLLTVARGARKSRKRLDNIYFDTPDRALATLHIGLRLRKDGRRWLQTVKSGGSAQSGLHQREEIEFAVAGKALEWAQLSGTVVKAVLGPLAQRLTPQFRTLFTRDIRLLRGPSGAEIELAIDQGEIIAGSRRAPICEVELELKSGSVDYLFEVALELAERHPLVLCNRSKAERGNELAQALPPGPPVKAAPLQFALQTDAPTIARLAIENCTGQWQANETGYLAQLSGDGYDSEYLHQLRVGVRRLRVACDPLARLAGWHAETLAAVKAPLRRLGQQLGAARDWDVFVEEIWPTLNEALDNPAARTVLREAIDLQRDLAHRQARAALASRETQRALLLLSRCLATDSQPEVDNQQGERRFNALNRQLDDYYRKLSTGQDKLETLSPERRHALRITAKKLRYLTEFMASRYSRRDSVELVQRWLTWLKKAQDSLGGRNDHTTAAARIEMLAKSVTKRDRKKGQVKRALLRGLDACKWPELDLGPLPSPYWR